MNITSAKYYKDNNINVSVNATIDGIEMAVPMDINNVHYAAILKWVEEDGGEIQAAD